MLSDVEFSGVALSHSNLKEALARWRCLFMQMTSLLHKYVKRFQLTYWMIQSGRLYTMKNMDKQIDLNCKTYSSSFIKPEAHQHYKDVFPHQLCKE